MSIETFCFVFFLVGTFLLIFRNFFVEISSAFDWIFGSRFEESMKKFRKALATIVGAGFVILSIDGLYPFLKQKLGTPVLIIFLAIYIFGLIFILKKSYVRPEEHNQNVKSKRKYFKY